MTETQWKSTETPKTPCPFCGYGLDTAGSPEGKSPKPGDVSICMSCTSLMIFKQDLTLRPMTTEEYNQLDEKFKVGLRLYQNAIRSIDRRDIHNENYPP